MQSYSGKTTSRAGFTLLDLVITVMIMGVLASVAAPKFAAALHRSRVDAAAKRIKVDLRYARQRAISDSTSIAITFTPGTASYSIPNLADLDRPGQTYAVSLDAAPYQVTLVSADLGGDTSVQFDHFGKPDSGGTITVASGSYQQTVTLDPETGEAAAMP